MPASKEFGSIGALLTQSSELVMSQTKAEHLELSLRYSGCCLTRSTAVGEKSHAKTRVSGRMARVFSGRKRISGNRNEYFSQKVNKILICDHTPGWQLVSKIGNTVFPTPHPTSRMWNLWLAELTSLLKLSSGNSVNSQFLSLKNRLAWIP